MQDDGQLLDHPQRTLITYWVEINSCNGRSGIVTGSVAGIIVSSLGERGSNGLQLGKKCADTHNRAYSGTWIVSAGERAAVACSGTAGWACARLGSANGSSWTLIIHDTFQFILQSQTEVQETYPAGAP